VHFVGSYRIIMLQCAVQKKTMKKVPKT